MAIMDLSRAAAPSSAVGTPGSSWVMMRKDSSAFGGKSAARPTPGFVQQSHRPAWRGDGGSEPALVRSQYRPDGRRRSATDPPPGPALDGATLDGRVEATGAVFEAKFMLPWSFSEKKRRSKSMRHSCSITFGLSREGLHNFL